VFFLDENIGFVLGEAMNGCLDGDCDKGCVLLKTTDGGESWVKAFFPEYSQMLSLKFFDALNGISLIYTTDVHVATTADGGLTWTLDTLKVQPSYERLFFADKIVFAAGKNQEIYKSSDFGKTWETINTPVEAWNEVRNLYFFNEMIGYIDGISAIYKTTDGGITWEKTNFPFSSFETFHFYNENEGFNFETVSVYDGGEYPSFKGSVCFETKDGGTTWSKSELMKTLYPGISYFPERNLGYSINNPGFWTFRKKE
jgi:photosystem II stability/assembly factor-like uncharacterized protein